MSVTYFARIQSMNKFSRRRIDMEGSEATEVKNLITLLTQSHIQKIGHQLGPPAVH
jgi:hypothetical protein